MNHARRTKNWARALGSAPWRILAFITALVVWSGVGICAAPQAGPTTVILVRHAERDSFFAADSPLSKKGQSRAAGLAYLLDQYQPVALFASDRVRTQQTLRPLADRLHLPISVWDYRQSETLGHHLRTTYPGKTVIVCWHHDHMEELARALGVRGDVPDWSLFTFNKIWTVTLGAGGQVGFHESREWGGP